MQQDIQYVIVNDSDSIITDASLYQSRDRVATSIDRPEVPLNLVITSGQKEELGLSTTSDLSTAIF